MERFLGDAHGFISTISRTAHDKRRRGWKGDRSFNFGLIIFFHFWLDIWILLAEYSDKKESENRHDAPDPDSSQVFFGFIKSSSVVVFTFVSFPAVKIVFRSPFTFFHFS